MEKKFKYRKLEFNEENVNELGSEGWRIVGIMGSSVIMEKEGEGDDDYSIDSMPVERTISNPKSLYKCLDKVKRYDWGNTYETAEFLTIEEFKNDDFYTDDGEYEAYLSDGLYFIGTNLSDMTKDELAQFIEENKAKLACSPEDLKIYYIDYPEDK